MSTNPKSSAMGRAYAKAKQRVLNSVGKKTTLTRNPRVDFLSGRMEEIVAQKCALKAQTELTRRHFAQLLDSSLKLNELILKNMCENVGRRYWDDQENAYLKLMAEDEGEYLTTLTELQQRMEQDYKDLSKKSSEIFQVFAETNDMKRPRVSEHLKLVAKVENEYKASRTAYSDVLIDENDGDVDGPSSPTIHKKKAQYNLKSEQLTELLLAFEDASFMEFGEQVGQYFSEQSAFMSDLTEQMEKMRKLSLFLARKSAETTTEPLIHEIVSRISTKRRKEDSIGAISPLSQTGTRSQLQTMKQGKDSSRIHKFLDGKGLGSAQLHGSGLVPQVEIQVVEEHIVSQDDYDIPENTGMSTLQVVEYQLTGTTAATESIGYQTSDEVELEDTDDLDLDTELLDLESSEETELVEMKAEDVLQLGLGRLAAPR